MEIQKLEREELMMKKQTIGKAAAFLCALVMLFAVPFCAAAQDLPRETESANTVQVSTVDEFLAAIGPDVEIVLAPGEYNLTQAKGYGRTGGQYYHWESTFDGYELVITDASNLTINGLDASLVTISTEPRYSNVLRFDYAANLTISNITLGHTKEQGSCIGGVLLVESGSNVEIQNARLYGCGVRGIDLRSCQNVHVDCTDVYECSMGCVYIQGSTNVLFENSKFYNCALADGVFEIFSSSDIAVINSEVYGNWGEFFYSSLVYSDCPGIYLGGLDIHDNQFIYMFRGDGSPVTVENCRFDYAEQWAENVMPVSPDGQELTAGDLASMKMRTVTWEPAGRPEVPDVQAGEDGKIHVTNVDEFLAAIAPNTTIFLEPGEYDLSTSATYAGLGGDYYHWESVFDGYELVIRGASNLTIEAADPENVSIVTQPRYANVLRFENLSNVILRNVTAGHTPEAGECAGGVIQLSYANNSIIEGCRLFGCGILGVQAISCNNLSVYNCEIYQCSSGAAWFYGCKTVRMDHCNIHDIGGRALYADYYCSDVLVDGNPIPDDF